MSHNIDSHPNSTVAKYCLQCNPKSDFQRLMEMRLLRNDVLIEWEEAQGYVKCGKISLVRPDTYRETHYTGTVVNVGPDVKDVEVGDRIFFDQFGRPERFDFDGRRFALLAESAILAKVEERTEVAA